MGIEVSCSGSRRDGCRTEQGSQSCEVVGDKERESKSVSEVVPHFDLLQWK